MESVEEWGALLAPPESRNGSWRRFLFREIILPNNIINYLCGCQIRTYMLCQVYIVHTVTLYIVSLQKASAG